eukprot:2820934-Prymnesium_polylepis.1
MDSDPESEVPQFKHASFDASDYFKVRELARPCGRAGTCVVVPVVDVAGRCARTGGLPRHTG